MSDLTEDELNAASTAHDRLSAINVNAWVDPVALIEADRLQRAAIEIRRHRSALADQLATARPAPGILERGELDYLLDYLAQQRAEAALEGRSGDSDAFLCWHAALSRLLGAMP